MARILVCADGFFRNFSPFGLEPYIESFINSLVQAGNDVLPYIAKDFKKKSKIKDFIKKNKLGHWGTANTPMTDK